VSNVQLNGFLPGEQANGLADIAADMIAEPRIMRTVIMLIDTSKITSKVDDRSKIATARIRHIEPLIDRDDLAAADQLLRAALRRRTGSDALPGSMDQAELPFTDDEEEE
jgi:hypothetical protein